MILNVPWLKDGPGGGDLSVILIVTVEATTNSPGVEFQWPAESETNSAFIAFFFHSYKSLDFFYLHIITFVD